MARTAVVAGTATAVSGGMIRHSQKKQMEAEQDAMYEQQQQQAQMQAMVDQAVAQQQAAAPPPPPAAPAPAAAAPDTMAQLQQLAQMKEQGLLSDEEFTAAKAKLLG
jgi:hypothetical protein